jgi:hypothetical protein
LWLRTAAYRCHWDALASEHVAFRSSLAPQVGERERLVRKVSWTR